MLRRARAMSWGACRAVAYGQRGVRGAESPSSNAHLIMFISSLYEPWREYDDGYCCRGIRVSRLTGRAGSTP